MNYYKDDMDAYLADKAQIFLHQKEGDICIVGEQVVPYIEDKYPDVYARAIVVGNNSKLDKTKTHFVGEHTMRNLSLVYEVLTHFALSPENIRKAFADLRPVAGRLELISEKNNIRIYNDNNATTPDATIAGLQAVGDKSNTYLIIGGADKGLSTETLSDTVGLKVAHTYVIPGSGSDGFVEELAQKNIPYTRVDTLEEAVASAWSRAQAGDCLLFSPAFASFGMYNNEYERNDEFVEIVRNIQE